MAVLIRTRPSVFPIERPNLGGLTKGQATTDGRTDRPKQYADDAFVIKLN